MKNKIKNRSIHSCKKATELIERREDFPLSTIEKLKLKMHLLMCNKCHSYAEESALINKMLKDIPPAQITENVSLTHPMSSEKKTRLKEMLRDQKKNIK